MKIRKLAIGIWLLPPIRASLAIGGVIVWSLLIGHWDFVHADSWSETTFTAGAFSNTVTTTGSAEVILDIDASQETFSFIGSINKHSFCPRTNGTLWTWGYNGYGQVGDGTTANKSSPVQVAGTTWKQVAGSFHTAAIKTDGTLWAWGWNFYGQLGDGTTVNKSSPVQIAGTTWKQVVCGEKHTVAVKTDGTLWAWGYNGTGQLGDGTLVDKSSPIQVGALTTWKQVACGSQYTVAVRTDGTLWAWGYNGNGQLGDGTITQRTSPVQIAGTTWKQVACGSQYTVAVRTDGTLWAWGYNGCGQLGDGTITKRTSPVQIAGTAWKQVACGENHTLAVKTDGTLWAWGSNNNGQLGDGTTVSKYSPVQIGAATTWKQVACGESHTLAVQTDGKLWTWGDNIYGQLGDGTTVDKSSPVQIAGTIWKGVVPGPYFASGVYTSTAIAPLAVSYWGILTYTKTTPANTILTVDILKSSDNSLLVANCPSGTDLKTAYPAIFTGITGIKLRGNFSTSDGINTPTLSDWGLQYICDTVVTTTNWTDVTQGKAVQMGQSVAQVKFDMVVSGTGTAKWKKLRIDKGVGAYANIACPDSKIEVQVWMENNNNGFWDVGDILISKGNFANGTCYLNMKRWQVTTTSKTYYIVYKLANDIGGGQRAGVKIVDSSYLEFENATAIGVPP